MIIVLIILAVSTVQLMGQRHALNVHVPEQLDLLIKNDQVGLIHVYFTSGTGKFDKIENKLIEIFSIERDKREIRRVSMNYDKYHGYWTFYGFNDDWNLVKEEQYKKDTIVYAMREFLYNEHGEVIEEHWTNSFNEDKLFLPYLHRRLIFQERRVIRRTVLPHNKQQQSYDKVITDVFDRRNRLKKRLLESDRNKITTTFDRKGREKKVLVRRLDTLTNRFRLHEIRRHKYTYVPSEERLIIEIRTTKDSLIRISRREYLKGILIFQKTSENGATTFEQCLSYSGNLLVEKRVRLNGYDKFSIYKYEYLK